MNPQHDPQKTEVRETTQQSPDGNVRQTVTTMNDDQPQEVAPGPVVAQRVVYYIGGAIILLLVLRMLLFLLGANRGNAFANFIFDLSAVFAAPFFGLFSYQPAYGVSVFETSTLVAIIMYAIFTIGIAKLFTLTRR